MTRFNPENAQKSEKHEKLYQTYGYLYNAVDLLAGLCFVAGSICFFYEGAVKTAGVWLFVAGSALFVLRPSVKLVREAHLNSLPTPQ